MYHYTNRDGANGILRTGLIYKSKFYCLLGEGVYFTDLPPSKGKQAILLNNYGKTTNGQGVEKDRANFCFKFKTVELFGAYVKNVKGRVIWRYPENIDLYEHWYAYGKTEDPEKNYIVHHNSWDGDEDLSPSSSNLLSYFEQQNNNSSHPTPPIPSSILKCQGSKALKPSSTLKDVTNFQSLNGNSKTLKDQKNSVVNNRPTASRESFSSREFDQVLYLFLKHHFI